MTTTEQALKIAAHFALSGAPVHAESNSSGLINSTSVLTAKDGTKYILQKINTAVFRHPDEVMSNIVRVTGYLKNIIRKEGGDETRQTLTVIPTVDGASFYTDEEGGAWRCYLFITDAVCYDSTDSPELFLKVGKAFGRFQKQLSDFDASVLYETIPKFHDTESRFADFERALRADVAGRAAGCREEIDFILSRKNQCSFITEGIRSGRFPLRVTHNDTKLNNIMMDRESGEGLCVIDLDTVMPGSMLCDYGDAIRYGASNAAEDETDLSKVFLRFDLFEAFTEGFLSEVGESATREEILALPMGIYVMTLELAIRFLGDYLAGDTYFRVTHDTHNLERARTQEALLLDIEKRMPEMQRVIEGAL